MTSAWIRPATIIAVVAILLFLNAREFKAKRRALEQAFPDAPAADALTRLARRQAFQSLTNEQLLHMIHTMLAAILAALLWR
jgi:hypothetical protein